MKKFYKLILVLIFIGSSIYILSAVMNKRGDEDPTQVHTVIVPTTEPNASEPETDEPDETQWDSTIGTDTTGTDPTEGVTAVEAYPTTENSVEIITTEKSSEPVEEGTTEAAQVDGGFVPSEGYNYVTGEVHAIAEPGIINVLVNKLNQLPSDYVPADLVVPDVRFSFSGDNPKKYMRSEAAKALETLFKAAKESGHVIYAISGYRSYETQKRLYTNYVNQYGQTSADRFSAKPGMSEHQTGLAMDITSESVGFGLETDFGETSEGIWLADNAHKHGFILRYPSNKTDITGYMYEPWHFRYVGISLAQAIYDSKLSLEEYYEVSQK